MYLRCKSFYLSLHFTCARNDVEITNMLIECPLKTQFLWTGDFSLLPFYRVSWLCREQHFLKAWNPERWLVVCVLSFYTKLMSLQYPLQSKQKMYKKYHIGMFRNSPCCKGTVMAYGAPGPPGPSLQSSFWESWPQAVWVLMVIPPQLWAWAGALL